MNLVQKIIDSRFTHIVLVAFSIWMILVALLVGGASAQSPLANKQAITDLERRVAGLETQRLEARVSVLESAQEKQSDAIDTQIFLLKTNLGSSAAIILGIAAAALRGKKLVVAVQKD